MLRASEKGEEPGEQRRFAVAARKELQAVSDEVLEEVAAGKFWKYFRVFGHEMTVVGVVGVVVG